MAPMQFIELSQADREFLLSLAKKAVKQAVLTGNPLAIDLADMDLAAYSAVLREPRASFVTLHLKGKLRGCIGTLEPLQSLVESVVHNAYSAALHDPRFLAVTEDEEPDLEYEISVLSPSQRVKISSEEELFDMLEPGKDGVVLDDGIHRSTYLPSVWEQLPEPREFIKQLKLKAGLPGDYWSNKIRVSLYTTESFQ